MKIKEVCERTGLTRRAVRFYEEKGLISPEIREENEYRDYTEADVRRLRLVARLRGYRFSVEAIRRLLERPQEAGAVFAAHRQELADEHGETAAILEALDRLRLPADGSPEALNEALCRAEDEGTALPPRDLEPDFGRFEELTRGERDALSRRAAENVRRMEKKRRRRWTALAAAAAVLAAAAGGFGLWARWETEPVSCVSTIGLELVYSSGEWDEALSASVAEFEMALPDEEPALYRLRFPDTEAGSVLSKSLLPGARYAGFTCEIALPRREARSLGLLQPDGSLNIPAVLESTLHDEDFALRYAELREVHSGH